MGKYLQLLFTCFLLVVIENSYCQKIQLTAYPDNYIYVFEESNKDSISNLIIHNIGILNKGKLTFKLSEVSILFYKNNKIFQQNTFFIKEILKSSSSLYQLQQMNLLAQYDFMFRTKDLLQQAKLSNTDTLLPNTALILKKLFFTTSSIPDSIIIKAQGFAGAKNITASKSLLVKIHRSTHQYLFPMKGSWYVAAGPSAHTHHRWGYMEEFAYDIVKFGDDNLTYKGDYTKLENYYCYGKDILAVEDGVIEDVLNDIDEAEIYPKTLAQDKYMQFIKQRQSLLIEKYGMAGVGGNYVIIKHSNNEYSYYGHLKKGSVTGKKGDRVQTGQVIAQIGNSGNSTEPHLHFQMNESKDVLNVRSIPVRFSNIDWSESLEPQGSYLKSGEIIKTK